MAQPNQESIQESSEDSTSPNAIKVFHHVHNNVLKIKEDETDSLSKWNTELMMTSLNYVFTFIMNWTISMTSETTEWMDWNVS